MDLQDFDIDPDAYENGKRFVFGAKSYVCMRAIGSARAEEVRKRLWQPYEAWTDVPAVELAKINAMWLAQGILTEIVGFTDGGKPFAVDLTKEEDRLRLSGILKTPEKKAFVRRLMTMAGAETGFQVAKTMVTEKNSGGSPAGASPGGEPQSS